MSLEETIATLVEQAVSRAMAPVAEELQRLRAEKEEAGVSYEEAAQRLGVSKKTIQRKVRSGELPTVPGIHPPRVLLSAVLKVAA